MFYCRLYIFNYFLYFSIMLLPTFYTLTNQQMSAVKTLSSAPNPGVSYFTTYPFFVVLFPELTCTLSRSSHHTLIRFFTTPILLIFFYAISLFVCE